MDIAKPDPTASEVLIQVHAASVNAYDWRHIRAKPFLFRLSGAGFFKPKHTIPGVDVAGIVEKVGNTVTQFQPGDAVFADLSSSGSGGFAQYVCANESVVALKPAASSFESAASLPMAAVAALQGLRDAGEISAGKKVAIVGASGGVGTFAVQIAKTFGAHVTGVCGTNNLARIMELGADQVIDYTTTNFTQQEQQYDLIFAISGYHSIVQYKHVLAPNGIYVMCGGATAQIVQGLLLGPLMSWFDKRKFRSFNARPDRTDLAYIGDMIETGRIKPVIDRTYPLEQIADAIRYLELGHAYGKVVITIA